MIRFVVSSVAKSVDAVGENRNGAVAEFFDFESRSCQQVFALK